jgi:hypothetical protein
MEDYIKSLSYSKSILIMENKKPTAEEVFDNKRTDKVYVSPQFAHKNFIKDSTGAVYKR